MTFAESWTVPWCSTPDSVCSGGPFRISARYDAAGAPLYAAFQPTPDLATYASTHPDVAFDELNAPSAYGAAESLRMNFSNADLTPEQPLNEIIWKSVKGASSPMPPPRRLHHPAQP